MLTVSISINGETVYARSARRQKEKVNLSEKVNYKTDAGDIIEFTYGDSIIELAKLILDTIEEDY